MQVITEEPTAEVSTDSSHVRSKYSKPLKLMNSLLSDKSDYFTHRTVIVHVGSSQVQVLVTEQDQTIAWLADTALVKFRALHQVYYI